MTTSQDVCIRVLLRNGEVVRITRIISTGGQLSVRTPRGQVFRSEEILKILGTP